MTIHALMPDVNEDEGGVRSKVEYSPSTRKMLFFEGEKRPNGASIMKRMGQSTIEEMVSHFRAPVQR